jgi:hypothetical protein
MTFLLSQLPGRSRRPKSSGRMKPGGPAGFSPLKGIDVMHGVLASLSPRHDGGDAGRFEISYEY